MRRDELTELGYITPIANLPSIIQRGILSHRRTIRLEHRSVAMTEIQARRSQVAVPSGRSLHEYVNLYICVRNPMMFKRRSQIDELCVLAVSPRVLDRPGVVVTDSNASSKYVRFAGGPDGLRIVDRELTYADDWTDADPLQYFRKKAAKCAEVLVPDCVEPQYLLGAYVAHAEARRQVEAAAPTLPATVNSHLFFV